MPKRLRIKGDWYSLRVKKEVSNERGELVHGTTCPDNRKIEIERKKYHLEEMRVLFHEYHHALLKSCGLTEIIGDSGKVDKDRVEEAVCISCENMAQTFTFREDSEDIEW